MTSSQQMTPSTQSSTRCEFDGFILLQTRFTLVCILLAYCCQNEFFRSTISNVTPQGPLRFVHHRGPKEVTSSCSTTDATPDAQQLINSTTDIYVNIMMENRMTQGYIAFWSMLRTSISTFSFLICHVRSKYLTSRWNLCCQTVA